MRNARARASAILSAAMTLGGCCLGGGGAPAASAVPVAPPVAPPTAPPPSAAVLDVGAPVLAAWHAGRFWFAGVVVGSEGADLRVMYADGTSEVVPAASVVPDRLGPGAAIDAHQISETEFAHATLVARIGYAVRVRYEDGHEMWTSVGLVRVDSEGAPPTLSPWTPEPPVAGTSAPGAQVLARYEDGFLYSAVVIDPAPSGAPRVLYADGSGEETSADRVFPDTLGPESAVQVRDRAADATLAGTVVRRVQHAVEVRLADGSSRWFALADTRVDPAAP